MTTPVRPEPHVLADEPVLDMLNTRANVDGEPYEFWHTDADVERWLVRLGWIREGEAPAFDEGALLATAKALREVIRALLQARKAGVQADPVALNGFLRKAVSHPELTWPAPDELHLVRRRKLQTPEQFLSPIAEAAATLLVDADFNLIRTCEHPDCVLWFYDRTKAHKRRWCSMALCGNRHKVAEFRKRKLV